MRIYRILIVDDHPLARSAVRTLLEDESGFEIAGETDSGPAALEACAALKPDAVLMDIRMAGMDGLEATRLIKQKFPDIKVVMLSASDAAADLISAVQFGAQGYLLKDMDPSDWLSYLRALLEDDPEIPRRMADRLFYRFKGRSLLSDASLSSLTPRETELLAYIASGETNRHIADALIITEHTVKNHVKHMLDKLKLDNRVQLAAFAVQHGLGPIRGGRTK